MTEDTRVDKTVNRLKNHKLLATVIVIGLAVIAVGSFTDALGKIGDFVARFRTSGDPLIEELIKNVSDYVVDARIERVDFSGDVVITPVGLFRDPPNTLVDGFPSDYTYLLCRFTNTSEQPVTIGAVVDGDNDYYILDDPNFGYRPIVTTLMQFQMWFRGEPVERTQLKKEESRIPDNFIDAATLEPRKTKYGYITNPHEWPEEITFTVIDVTDTTAGTVTLQIRIQNTNKDN